MKIKLKYLIQALKEQLPLKRLFYNFFVTGNAWGMFSKRAHYTAEGKEKVGYNTKESALNVAEVLGKKRLEYYSTYFCPRCGKYHLGKNRN